MLGTLALRTDCADLQSEVACISGPRAALEGLELEAGTYYVFVRGGGGPEEALLLRPTP